MKLEDIIELWEEDSEIDRDMLIDESLKIPKLHKKYYVIYLNEVRVLSEQQEKLKNYIFQKWLYYQKKLPTEVLKERKWEQFDITFLKGDINMVVEADDDVINKKLNIAEQSEKVKFVQDIIKTIHQRTYVIKNALEHSKFISGA